MVRSGLACSLASSLVLLPGCGDGLLFGCRQAQEELETIYRSCDCGEPPGSDGDGDSGGGSATGGTGGGSDGDTAGASDDSACLAVEEELEQAKRSCDCTPPGGEEPAQPWAGPDQVAAACGAAGPVTLYLSADDSNSMSSPVMVREAVLSGWSSLTGVPIRAWEFLNYYTFDYPAAPPGEVAVTVELAGEADGPVGEYLLQIGVSSEAIAPDERPPINLTWVLDTSGSMQGSPMEMQRAALRAMVGELRQGDVVSAVTWSVDNAVELDSHAVTGPEDPVLLALVDGLEAGGGTNLHGGLVAGYELASKNATPGMLDRIVLISDGGANVGITDEQLIASHAGSNDEDGIYMVGVGVGSEGTYNDLLMDTVTDVGKGASVFIPTQAEADMIFGERFVNSLYVAARDVQVKLDLPPGFEIVTFSGEEYGTDPKEIEPQHLAPNDAMVFHQRIRTCASGLIEDDTAITVTAGYRDADTFQAREVATTRTFGELVAASAPRLREGAAMVAVTDALQAARDGDANERSYRVGLAAEALDLAEAANPGDPDLAELREILEAL